MKRLPRVPYPPSSSRQDNFGDKLCPGLGRAQVILEERVLASGGAVLALAPFMEEGAKLSLAESTVLKARS